jgi:hypothetical protein
MVALGYPTAASLPAGFTPLVSNLIVLSVSYRYRAGVSSVFDKCVCVGCLDPIRMLLRVLL